MAALDPLAGALHSRAGSGGDERTVTSSPGPWSRANVYPDWLTIVAVVSPAVAVAPGTGTVVCSTSRVTSMTVCAGAAVGEPDCTTTSIVAFPVAVRSMS